MIDLAEVHRTVSKLYFSNDIPTILSEDRKSSDLITNQRQKICYDISDIGFLTSMSTCKLYLYSVQASFRVFGRNNFYRKSKRFARKLQNECVQ